MEFTAEGTPRAQGSKTQGMTKDGRPYMRESNARLLTPWRKAVRAAAKQAMGGSEPRTGPVVCVISFYLLRPKSHPVLSQTWPTAKNVGDVDKMLRAVLDAMTGVVFVDDSQVVQETSRKLWADRDHPEGVHVWVGRPSGYPTTT